VIGVHGGLVGMAHSSAVRLAALTALAMGAFAANSVLNRVALAGGAADALTYTGIRLASGAVMLGLILSWRGSADRPGPRGARIGGSARGACALFLYAITFSYAYLELAAGTGALLLFAAVQFGMLGWAIRNGDKPGPLEWAGFGMAILFLGLLVMPGLTAPEPLGAALMIIAGFAWGVYTLLGRGSANPLVDTGGNFVRCLPIAILMILPGLFGETTSVAGWVYAIASGALASGLGYAIWYTVLPALERSTAAYVQLSVPAIAAAGGVLFIAEPMTLRLVICSTGILDGVGLALWGADRRRRVTTPLP
jgi:drug/metabolite transporter (DMT)-like permease